MERGMMYCAALQDGFPAQNATSCMPCAYDYVSHFGSSFTKRNGLESKWHSVTRKSSDEKYFKSFLPPAFLCHICDTVSFSNKRLDIPQAQNEIVKVDLSFIHLIHLLRSKKPFQVCSNHWSNNWRARSRDAHSGRMGSSFGLRLLHWD